MRTRLAAVLLPAAVVTLGFATPAQAVVDPEPTQRTFYGIDMVQSAAVVEAEAVLALAPAQKNEVCVETGRRVYQIALTGQWLVEIDADCLNRFTL